jgi:hypothetical protein
MLEIRSALSAVPDTRLTFFQDPVRFEDALGRMTLFPSEFSVDDLEAIVERRFQEGPGKQHVQAGDYELCNTRNTRQVISASNGVGLLPGMNVRMAIVIKRSTSSGDLCPMPQCRSSNTESVSGGGRKWLVTLSLSRSNSSTNVIQLQLQCLVRPIEQQANMGKLLRARVTNRPV